MHRCDSSNYLFSKMKNIRISEKSEKFCLVKYDGIEFKLSDLKTYFQYEIDL